MIKPLPGYVLIEPIQEESVTAGGIYKPESSQDKPMKGKIIAGTFNLESKLQRLIQKEIMVGDVVIYKKWTNQEVQHEGKDYLLVALSEVLGVIK